jgi:hypothetical protein
MKIITFDAHLIELDDLAHVQEHIQEHQPCVAYFQVTYPQGNTHYFMAAADGVSYSSVSIGKPMYDLVLRINI